MTLLDAPPEPVARLGTVQWYIPFTAVHPATAAAAPPDAIWVDVSGGPYAYYDALCQWWYDALAAAKAGNPYAIAILEHDVICRPDIIAEFETCTEPWCVFSYAEMCCQDATGYSPCREAWRNQLGCTRFRSELIQAVPNALRDIPTGLREVMADNGSVSKADLRDWHHVCDGLGGRRDGAGVMYPNSLRAHHLTHHWHKPHVAHHSETGHLAQGRNADGTDR